MTEPRIERYIRIAREVLAETVRVSWILFRITIPVVILVKVLEELGAILTSMMLVAHNLPVELRVAQRAGSRLVTMSVIRIGGALAFGFLLHLAYCQTGLLQHESVLLRHHVTRLLPAPGP